MDDAAKAFADIATLTVIHHGGVSAEQLALQTQAALPERIIIEQAKGVLACTENLEMDAAFDRLVAVADQANQPISRVAAQITTAAETTID